MTPSPYSSSSMASPGNDWDSEVAMQDLPDFESPVVGRPSPCGYFEDEIPPHLPEPLSPTGNRGQRATAATAPAPRSETKTDSSRSRGGSLSSTATGSAGQKHDSGEEHIGQARRPSDAAESSSSGHTSDMGGLMMKAPTDRAIDRDVDDICVPAAVRRQFEEINPPPVPPGGADGQGTMPRGKSSLTLRQHVSTLDRLEKENFDLKLKIYHLNRALHVRSDESIQVVLAENVDIRCALQVLHKQNQELRARVSELEGDVKRAEQRGRDEAAAAAAVRRAEKAEKEVTHLRERIKRYEIEVAQLKGAAAAKLQEERRASTHSRTASADRTPDPAAAASASQRQRSHSDGSRGHGPRSSQPRTVDAERPAERGSGHGSTVGSSASTLVEHLHRENESLRREIGAQASMLTSRNREREHLHQEIEELRLGHLRGERIHHHHHHPNATDAAFDPSGPRARQRAGSRTSADTPVTVLSDVERALYEHELGQLRGDISAVRLDNQQLTKKLHECLDDLDQAAVKREKREKELEAELALAARELRAAHRDRDDAAAVRRELEAAFDDLKREAEGEIGQLEGELEDKRDQVRQLKRDLANRHESFHSLQAEMRSLSEAVLRLEDEQRTRSREVVHLQDELQDTHAELSVLERTLRDANMKVERGNVQLQSSQSEIAFLREEQVSDKLKIGQLELAGKQSQESIKALEDKVREEGQAHERLMSTAKEEAQRAVDDLNRQLSSAEDEVGRLRTTVTSTEAELQDRTERLRELEHALREVLGEPDASGPSLLRSVARLQEELEAASVELESAKGNLADRERLLRHRDGLLESAGLESRKLSEMLERERQARKTDRHHYEQLEKSTRQALRSATQQEGRVLELEAARQADRKKAALLETQHKEQLAERNNLLLALWNRLSTMCGTEWLHKHSQVGGKLPSLDVIASQLPAFSKNLLSAVKMIEHLVGTLKIRIRNVEKDLWKDYQTLEHNVDVRLKRLDRLETYFYGDGMGAPYAKAETAKAENAQLRRENQTLRTELNVLQQQDMPPRPGQHVQRSTSGQIPTTGGASADSNHAAMTAFARHHSTTGVGLVDPLDLQGRVQPSVADQASEQRWIHRLRELEKRLKAEREARLLDRSGARKRLEEGRAEYEQLKQELERERVRKGN